MPTTAGRTVHAYFDQSMQAAGSGGDVFVNTAGSPADSRVSAKNWGN